MVVGTELMVLLFLLLSFLFLLFFSSSSPPPQDACRKIHALIDKVDEERYDLEVKVGKASKEVSSR